MTLKLNGSSSGSVSIDAPASTTGGADVTLTLPVDDGDAGQVLKTNGSGALSWTTPGLVFTQTAEVTLPTDAQYYEWTGIPANWKRLRLCMANVTLNQHGTVTLGGITSGYSSGGTYVASGNALHTSTSGFIIYGGAAFHGVMEFMPMDASGTPDKYISWHNGTNGTSSTRSGGGQLTGVSSSITTIRLTRDDANFGSGTACLQYEVPAS